MASILSRPQCVNSSHRDEDWGDILDDEFKSIFLNKNL